MDDARPATRAESAPASLWSIVLLAVAPFPVAAMAYAYGAPDLARTALDGLLTWSVVVMAFLGGARWGLESAEPAPRWPRLAISVLTPTLAWTVLMARGRLEESWVVGGILVAFLAQWLFDHQTPETPSRYPRLSTALTAAACISLALVLEKALGA